MTTHLDEVELVDALDGLLSPSRDTHLEQCCQLRRTPASLGIAGRLAAPSADSARAVAVVLGALLAPRDDAVRETARRARRPAGGGRRA